VADYYYVGSGTPDNWSDDVWASSSGGSPLTSDYPDDNGDKAIFDSNGSGDVLLDASVTIGELAQSGNTGNLDLDDKTLTVDDAGAHNGDVTLDGTIDFGTGAIDCDGSVTATAIDDTPGGTGKLIMRGASKTLTWSGHGARPIPHLEIAAGASVTQSAVGESKFLTVAGTFTHDVADGVDDGITVAATGTINGTGAIDGSNLAIDIASGGDLSVDVTSTNGVVITSGSIFNAGLKLYVTGNFSITLPAAVTVKGTFNVYSRDEGETLTLDLDTNDTSLTLEGDVEVGAEGDGSVTWTAGTGTITLSGSNDQSIDFDGKSVEDIVVNKTAGDVTMGANVTTQSFTGTSTGTGDFDPNGKTITVDPGNCSWASAFTMEGDADQMNGCTWDISGNFTADGQTLSATAAWYLYVDGTAVASGTGDVEYCDASDGAGSTEIDASAGPWTDSGNNDNWDFGAAGPPSGAIMNQMQFGNLGADLYNGTMVA